MFGEKSYKLWKQRKFQCQLEQALQEHANLLFKKYDASSGGTANWVVCGSEMSGLLTVIIDITSDDD